MSLDGAVIAGRQMAEARMLDSCTVGEQVETVDPVTLQNITETLDQYTGRCRFSTNSVAVSDANGGGQAFASQDLILSVPVFSGGQIRTNATVTCDSVDPISGNPAMVGRKFRVKGLASASQTTAARFSVELLS
jgi:hypothetical protein